MIATKAKRIEKHLYSVLEIQYSILELQVEDEEIPLDATVASFKHCRAITCRSIRETYQNQ